MSQQNSLDRSIRSTLPASALVVAAAVVAMTAACSKTPEPAMHEAHDATSMPAGQMDNSKMDGMQDMGGKMHMDGMSMTGDTDYDFAANMRMHHQAAVDMSEAYLKNGKNLQMLQTAREIIAAQKKEIAVFDKWIEAHGKPSGMTPK